MMKKVSNKLFWVIGVVFLLAVIIIIVKIADYTKNAVILQGEKTENADSVKVLFNGQYQTTNIVKTYMSEQDSSIEYLVTPLGVVETKINID